MLFMDKQFADILIRRTSRDEAEVTRGGCRSARRVEEVVTRGDVGHVVVTPINIDGGSVLNNWRKVEVARCLIGRRCVQQRPKPPSHPSLDQPEVRHLVGGPLPQLVVFIEVMEEREVFVETPGPSIER